MISGRVVDQLRKLAEEADGDGWLVPLPPSDSPARRFTDFLTACSPAVIRQLLDDRDAMAAKIAAVEAMCERSEQAAAKNSEPGDPVTPYVRISSVRAALAVGVRQDTGEDTER